MCRESHLPLPEELAPQQEPLPEQLAPPQEPLPEEVALRPSRRAAAPEQLAPQQEPVPEEVAPRPSRRAAAIIEIPPSRYPECLAILQSGFATVTADFGITAANTPSNPAFWTLADLERVAGRTQLYALEVDGALVGCAFVLASRSRPGTWELRHLAVRPDARHHGYGEELVAEGVRRAVVGGATVLRIGIVAENTRLAAWYHRLGFVTVEAGNQYPGLPFTVDHLELTLPSNGS